MYFSFSSKSILVTSLNHIYNCKLLCNYLCGYKSFLPSATKDSHINSCKNGRFGHKLQMHGLEWTWFFVVKRFKPRKLRCNMKKMWNLCSLQTPYRILLFFQLWITSPKGKFYKMKNLWLNIQMTSSKCKVNMFHNLIFMKVNIKKHCSSSIEPIIFSITSSADLMYLRIFSTKICDDERVFHNLVNGFTSKGFCITNLELFFMVMIKRNLFR